MLEPRKSRVPRRRHFATPICHYKLCFFLICTFLVLPFGITEYADEPYIVEPTPALRLREEDLTTVLLVNYENGRSSVDQQQQNQPQQQQHGRFLNVRPEVGLLTSTARTFIQEGVTTEYATQVVGTTLNNGRLYAQFLKKSSRVLYDNKDLLPTASVVTSWVGDTTTLLATKILPQSHNDLFNAEQPDWKYIDDRLLLERNADFVGNTDFVGLNEFRKYATHDTENRQQEQSAVVLTADSSIQTSGDIKAISENILRHYSSKFGEVARKLSANKVSSINELPTYTVKNHFAPSGYSWQANVKAAGTSPTPQNNGVADDDDDNDNDSNNAQLQDRSPKLYYKHLMGGQNRHGSSLVTNNKLPQALQQHQALPSHTFSTITYYGFADFTTIVGDSVIVFSPSTSTQYPNFGQVTSIKGEATLGAAVLDNSQVSNIAITITQDHQIVPTNSELHKITTTRLVDEIMEITTPNINFAIKEEEEEAKTTTEKAETQTEEEEVVEAVSLKNFEENLNVRQNVVLLETSEVVLPTEIITTQQHESSVETTHQSINDDSKIVKFSRPSDEEILAIYTSLASVDAARKLAAAASASETTTANDEFVNIAATVVDTFNVLSETVKQDVNIVGKKEDDLEYNKNNNNAEITNTVVQESNVQTLGGATTIFFEDDPFANFVDPTTIDSDSNIATAVLSMETTTSEEATTTALTAEDTETTTASLNDIDTTINNVEEKITTIADQTEQITNQPILSLDSNSTIVPASITTSLSNEVKEVVGAAEVIVKEITGSDDIIDVNCIRTSQVFLTQLPKTLTYLTTLLIQDNESTEQIHTSIQTNIVPTFDITQATKHYCIQASSVQTTLNTAYLQQIEEPQLERNNKDASTTEKNIVNEAIDENNSSVTNNNTIVEVEQPEDEEEQMHEDEDQDDDDDDVEQNQEEKTTKSNIMENSDYEDEAAVHSSEDDDESEDEIDLIYKTLYTTYTYLTTFFHEETTSISSHTEVVTNVITSTLTQENDIKTTKLLTNPQEISQTKTQSAIISSTKFVVPSEVESIIRENDKESSLTTIVPSLTTTTNEATAYLDDAKITKTYYTTYTYYTTIFADGETEIMSRTEVYKNFVTSSISPTKSYEDSTSIMTTNIGVSETGAVSNNVNAEYNVVIDNTQNTIPQRLNYNTQVRNITTTLPDEFSSITLVTDVRSSSSNGEQKIINNPALNRPNEPIDDQISSESNTDEIIPSATLLLQTSFTTFTYYTTMYSSDTTNIVSRLETVTNVVTETLQPTKTINLEEATLPITYFTTFTYWTKLAKNGEITTLSREETISNVVTPTNVIDSQHVSAAVEMDTAPSRNEIVKTTVVAPVSVSATIIQPVETTTKHDVSFVPAATPIAETIDAKPIDFSTAMNARNALEPTTYYTTYTYYTTSYETDKTITDSRFETVTNVITPTITPITDSATQVKDANANATTNIGVQADNADNLNHSTNNSNIVLYDYKKIIDAEGISTLLFTTQVVTTVDGAGMGIEATMSSSSLFIDEIKKALLPSSTLQSINAEGSTIRQYKTGLVRLIEGTRIGNRTTTLYQSKVIGTLIDNRYAQIIESTSSFLFEMTETPDSTFILPSKTQELLQTTQQSTINTINPSVVQSSINENSDGDETEDHTEHVGDDDEDEESEDEAGGKGRLPIQSKKRTFTPVIRPFASRNRPQFAPKKKNVSPSSATIITRSDFTPTITATPALKSSGRFSSSRKGAISSLPIATGSGVFGGGASSRRFSRPSKSSVSGSTQLFGSSGNISSNNGSGGAGRTRLSSSRISPVSSSRRGSSSLLRSSSPGVGGFRAGFSSVYAGNSRLRIKPTSTVGPGADGSSTLTGDNNSGEEESSTQDQVGDDENDENNTESSRRNQNPLLRFRRPVNRPSGFTPAVAAQPGSQRTNSTGNSPVSARRNPLSARTKTTSSTTSTTTTTARPRPRSFQRPTVASFQSRSRPQNSLFPPRGLFQAQKPISSDVIEENKDKKSKSGEDLNDGAESEDDSEYDDDDDEEGEDDADDDVNRRRRSNSKTTSESNIVMKNKIAQKRKSNLDSNLKSLTKRTIRVRREADTSLQTRTNFRNRFRRPTKSNKAEERSYDEDVSEAETVSTQATTTAARSRGVNARFSGRYQNLNSHHTTTAASTPSSSSSLLSSTGKIRAVRPTRPTSVRAQFTLREKDTATSTSTQKGHSRPNFRRPQTAASTRRSSAPSSTTSGSRRLKSYSGLNSGTTDSTSRTTAVGRSRNSQLGSSTSRTRGGSSVRGRNRNDYNGDSIVPAFDGFITVTHVIPHEVTIPVVNNKITEYKNVITAKTSTEVLSPQQYTSFVAANGQTMLVLTREETSINYAGATEITQFVLHETPTTTVTFTPTTIRGRKTSFSHVIPSTVYSVENVVSTAQPQISANAPLANILLSQLLLGGNIGNIGLPTNPLLGALGGAGTPPAQLAAAAAVGGGQTLPATPVTEFRTHTSTYVTTVVEGTPTTPVTSKSTTTTTTANSITTTKLSIYTQTENQLDLQFDIASPCRKCKYRRSLGNTLLASTYTIEPSCKEDLSVINTKSASSSDYKDKDFFEYGIYNMVPKLTQHTPIILATNDKNTFAAKALDKVDHHDDADSDNAKIHNENNKPTNDGDNYTEILDEARYNLATRIMSNGVEVIIASDKNKSDVSATQKSSGLLRIVPSPVYKPMTLAPSTLKNQMILVMPSNVQENFTISVNPNQFITKTCLTTYTYRTTYLQDGQTTVESRKKVISNIATEERNYLKISPVLSLGVTLTRTPELAIGVFPTTYSYFNTILDGELPLVVTSEHTVINTLTGPDDYISFLQPSEDATPIYDTNTYYSKITLTRTIRDADIQQIVSTANILTQVIVTESLPARSTSVLTSYFAFDVDETMLSPIISPSLVQKLGKTTTNLVKTKHITYTYLHTYHDDNGEEHVKTSLKTTHNIITEHLLFKHRNRTTTPLIHHTIRSASASASALTKTNEEPTQIVATSVPKLTDEPDYGVHIYATKTFLTTFTYFTTTLLSSSTRVHLQKKPLTATTTTTISSSASSKTVSTRINYHTRVIENVITETVPVTLLRPELISKFRTELKKGKNQRRVIVTMATLLGGQTLEITAVKMQKTAAENLTQQPATISFQNGTATSLNTNIATNKYQEATATFFSVNNNTAATDMTKLIVSGGHDEEDESLDNVDSGDDKDEDEQDVHSGGDESEKNPAIAASEQNNVYVAVPPLKSHNSIAPPLPQKHDNNNNKNKITKLKLNNNNSKLPVAMNQIIGSLNLNRLTALRPVFNAMAGLLQSNFATVAKEPPPATEVNYQKQQQQQQQEHHQTLVESKHTLNNITAAASGIYEDGIHYLKNYSEAPPIYIPVQNVLDELQQQNKHSLLTHQQTSIDDNLTVQQSPQSLHIQPPDADVSIDSADNWLQEESSSDNNLFVYTNPKQYHKQQHTQKQSGTVPYKTLILNGGIPIRPGEVITANSDVIVGKPYGIQYPRMPFNNNNNNQVTTSSLLPALEQKTKNGLLVMSPTILQAPNQQISFYRHVIQHPYQQKILQAPNPNVIPLLEQQHQQQQQQQQQQEQPQLHHTENFDSILKPPPMQENYFKSSTLPQGNKSNQTPLLKQSLFMLSPPPPPPLTTTQQNQNKQHQIQLKQQHHQQHQEQQQQQQQQHYVPLSSHGNLQQSNSVQQQQHHNIYNLNNELKNNEIIDIKRIPEIFSADLPPVPHYLNLISSTSSIMQSTTPAIKTELKQQQQQQQEHHHQYKQQDQQPQQHHLQQQQNQHHLQQKHQKNQHQQSYTSPAQSGPPFGYKLNSNKNYRHQSSASNIGNSKFVETSSSLKHQNKLTEQAPVTTTTVPIIAHFNHQRVNLDTHVLSHNVDINVPPLTFKKESDYPHSPLVRGQITSILVDSKGKTQQQSHNRYGNMPHIKIPLNEEQIQVNLTPQNVIVSIASPISVQSNNFDASTAMENSHSKLIYQQQQQQPPLYKNNHHPQHHIQHSAAIGSFALQPEENIPKETGAYQKAQQQLEPFTNNNFRIHNNNINNVTPSIYTAENSSFISNQYKNQYPPLSTLIPYTSDHHSGQIAHNTIINLRQPAVNTASMLNSQEIRQEARPIMPTNMLAIKNGGSRIASKLPTSTLHTHWHPNIFFDEENAGEEEEDETADEEVANSSDVTTAAIVNNDQKAAFTTNNLQVPPQQQFQSKIKQTKNNPTAPHFIAPPSNEPSWTHTKLNYMLQHRYPNKAIGDSDNVNKINELQKSTVVTESPPKKQASHPYSITATGGTMASLKSIDSSSSSKSNLPILHGTPFMPTKQRYKPSDDFLNNQTSNSQNEKLNIFVTSGEGFKRPQPQIVASTATNLLKIDFNNIHKLPTNYQQKPNLVNALNYAAPDALLPKVTKDDDLRADFFNQTTNIDLSKHNLTNNAAAKQQHSSSSSSSQQQLSQDEIFVSYETSNPHNYDSVNVTATVGDSSGGGGTSYDLLLFHTQPPPTPTTTRKSTPQHVGFIHKPSLKIRPPPPPPPAAAPLTPSTAPLAYGETVSRTESVLGLNPPPLPPLSSPAPATITTQYKTINYTTVKRFPTTAAENHQQQQKQSHIKQTENGVNLIPINKKPPILQPSAINHQKQQHDKLLPLLTTTTTIKTHTTPTITRQNHQQSTFDAIRAGIPTTIRSAIIVTPLVTEQNKAGTNSQPNGISATRSTARHTLRQQMGNMTKISSTQPYNSYHHPSNPHQTIETNEITFYPQGNLGLEPSENSLQQRPTTTKSLTNIAIETSFTAHRTSNESHNGHLPATDTFSTATRNVAANSGNNFNNNINRKYFNQQHRANTKRIPLLSTLKRIILPTKYITNTQMLTVTTTKTTVLTTGGLLQTTTLLLTMTQTATIVDTVTETETETETHTLLQPTRITESHIIVATTTTTAITTIMPTATAEDSNSLTAATTTTTTTGNAINIGPLYNQKPYQINDVVFKYDTSSSIVNDEAGYDADKKEYSTIEVVMSEDITASATHPIEISTTTTTTIRTPTTSADSEINNSIFIVMTNKNSKTHRNNLDRLTESSNNINAIAVTDHVTTSDDDDIVLADSDDSSGLVNIELDYDESISFDLPTRDEESIVPHDASKSNHVLLGGVLIATPPKSSQDSSVIRQSENDLNDDDTTAEATGQQQHAIDVTTTCRPTCKSSRNELCAQVELRLRCVCRPGFARMFPDRPCKPTYTYVMKMHIHRIGNYPLHYDNQLANNKSEDFQHLASITQDAVDRMVMQSDFRDVYHGVHLTTFKRNAMASQDYHQKHVVANFLLQLSDNSDEKRLESVFKKYLRISNYSVGGTELFTNKNGVEALAIVDFDECGHKKFHDCSSNARCFNLQGTYTCSCREGFVDLSENPIYPGRLCSAELIGCEKCHYHGKCIVTTTTGTSGAAGAIGSSICECFPWYTGASCQLNMKIMLIALIAIGTVLFILLLFCILLTCSKQRRKQHNLTEATSSTTAPSTLADMQRQMSKTKLNATHHLTSALSNGGRSTIIKNKNKSIRIEKLAMIKDSSSESSQNSLPYVLKKESKTNIQKHNSSNNHNNVSTNNNNSNNYRADLINDHQQHQQIMTSYDTLVVHPGSGENSAILLPSFHHSSKVQEQHYPDQTDRSLTVMIPRAKYHHPSVLPQTQLMHHQLTMERIEKPSHKSTDEIIQETTSNNNVSQIQRTPKRVSMAGCRHGDLKATSTGALISAGFEVSAMVNKNLLSSSSDVLSDTTNDITGGSGDLENLSAIKVGSSEIGGTAATMQIATTDSENLVSNRIGKLSTCNKANQNEYPDKDLIDSMDVWLDNIQQNELSAEARSFDETTVQAPTKSMRLCFDNQTIHTNDEANTMAERDIGSTFLLPHTHLYKPDRQESDISGFDSF